MGVELSVVESMPLSSALPKAGFRVHHAALSCVEPPSLSCVVVCCCSPCEFRRDCAICKQKPLSLFSRQVTPPHTGIPPVQARPTPANCPKSNACFPRVTLTFFTSSLGHVVEHLLHHTPRHVTSHSLELNHQGVCP
ncbi:hypothetical protein L1887_54035 [Cichorium endivia]|nr:hypothetical protein L1887_54035 [Cichorium endivia]